MTDTETADLVRLIADVYGFYREPVSEFALSVWCEAMKPYPLAAVRRAVTAHATDPQRGQFCPKPADVIRHLRGTAQEDALVAWQRLLRMARDYGRNHSPNLSEAERLALDGIGGWQRLCNSDESEHGFIQRDFVANFSAAASHEARTNVEPDESVAKLAGELIGRIAYGGDDGQ